MINRAGLEMEYGSAHQWRQRDVLRLLHVIATKLVR